MSKLGDFFKSIGSTFARAVGKTREQLEKFANNLKRDKSIGELEQRYSPMRSLGGFRLARTGKHRHGSLTRHQVAIRKPPGNKLWRKAAEGKL
jgi:hypothetical protein